jgi:hypothetical protein
MKLIGILLIIIGGVGVILGGVTFIRERGTAHAGSVDIVAESKAGISIPQTASVAAIIVGGLLVVSVLADAEAFRVGRLRPIAISSGEHDEKRSHPGLPDGSSPVGRRPIRGRSSDHS